MPPTYLASEHPGDGRAVSEMAWVYVAAAGHTLGMDEATTAELNEALPHIRQAPATEGTIEMIVRRRAVDEREVLDDAHLDPDVGLRGDNWKERGSRHTEDGAAEVDRQLTLMNSRMIDVLARTRDRWPLAGDQFFVDLDLSDENLPAGTLLTLGSAMVEVTAAPHTGCAKFIQRFGLEGHRFVNSEQGRALNLRGINARVVEAGEVRQGEAIRRV